jgi:hypothetical protein
MLYLLLFERKEEREKGKNREKWPSDFFPGQVCQGFPGC